MLNIGALQTIEREPRQQHSKVDLTSMVSPQVASNVTFRLLAILSVAELVSYVAKGCPTRNIMGPATDIIFSIVPSVLYKLDSKLEIASKN